MQETPPPWPLCPARQPAPEAAEENCVGGLFLPSVTPVTVTAESTAFAFFRKNIMVVPPGCNIIFMFPYLLLLYANPRHHGIGIFKK